MLIDIHTHIFPEKISERTIEVLKSGIRKIQGEDYPVRNYTDATRKGLLASMEETEIDISFVMPIATKPSQFDSINKFALEVSDGKIISFGSLHPYMEEPEKALEYLKEQGIRGIKLHPEFQEFYIDCGQSVNLIKKAHDLDMWVMLHTGKDIGLPPPCHCTPKMLKNLLNYVKGDKIIAAHLGSWQLWEDVYSELCGTEIYMDTAFIADFIDKKLCEKIIEKHGADKILFGSDSPWENPKRTLEFVNSLDIPEESKEKIKYKNAVRLFTIS